MAVGLAGTRRKEDLLRRDGCTMIEVVGSDRLTRGEKPFRLGCVMERLRIPERLQNLSSASLEAAVRWIGFRKIERWHVSTHGEREPVEFTW